MHSLTHPPLQAAAINAQQLARSPDGLPILLSLLEPEPSGMADFYARYHTLQVLKGLVATAPLALQQACAAGDGFKLWGVCRVVALPVIGWLPCR